MERRQLDHYCRLLSVYESGIRMSISNTLFELSYQFEGLKTEIITNKISLKKNGYAYLVLAETEIRKTIGHFGDEDYVESALGILKKYNIKLDDFLNHKIENKEFEEIFRREVNFDDKEKNKDDFEKFIDYYYQFCFFLVIRFANLVIAFINDLKDNSENKTKVTTPQSKQNQLTANKIILLLQEIGFFTHPKIEDASKVKQAELISQITGIHQKTIKSNIEKLEKSLSENGANYQKDIDKINKILDDLT